MPGAPRGQLFVKVAELWQLPVRYSSAVAGIVGEGSHCRQTGNCDGARRSHDELVLHIEVRTVDATLLLPVGGTAHHATGTAGGAAWAPSVVLARAAVPDHIERGLVGV